MNDIQIEITFKFEYQIGFSREFMIQHITTLFTCEHNQILFYITPCHDGSHYEKMNHIMIQNANPNTSPKVNATVMRCPK